MSKIVKLQNGKEVDFDILYPKERRFNVKDYPYWGNDDKDYYKPLTKEEIKKYGLQEI